MKKYILIILILSGFSSIAQIKSATLVASGLTCSMCSKAIYKALEALPVVQNVAVDIEKSSYKMTFKEGNISPDDIKSAVENAGFFVASLQLHGTFGGSIVGKDTHLDLNGSTYHFVGVKDQTLNGEKTITIVDRSYLPNKERKKHSNKTTMKCFETGYMASCCPSFANNAKRVYHVTL